MSPSGVFDGVVGNPEVLRALDLSLRDDNPSHAYLLHGPPGVGKTTVARRFAAALVTGSYSSVSYSSGGTPERALRGVHPDILEVEPEGQFTTIGQTREVVRAAASRPFEGVRRAILLRADTFNVPAANALLKTLEQPEGEAVFILLALSRESVLETISSRTRSVRFNPVAVQEVEGFLRERGVERPELWAALGRGSVGLSLRYATEQEFRQMREVVFEAGLRPPEDFEKLHRAVEEIVSRAEAVGAAAEAAYTERAREREEKGKQVTDGAKRVRRAGRDRAAVEALELLALLYRDLAAISCGAPELAANTDRLEELEQTAERSAGADWAEAARVASECRGRLTYNVTLESVLEVALLQIRRQIRSNSLAW